MAEGIQIKNLPSTTAIKQGDTMTIVQDKQNKQLALDVFANEFDLTTLSPLENRCDEVKAKIEVDEYSAEITTSQAMSKVGSDDNGANLHENVLDGAYESCVLKGKTMVNCIQEPSSKDVVLPYEFADGQYVTFNDTKESGALGVELKGQTKYRDIDTGEILETFEEGRNLELITVRMPILHTVGKNLFNKETALRGYYVSETTGEILGDGKNSLYSLTDYIEVIPNRELVNNDSASRRYAFYDKDKIFISGAVGSRKITVPSNAKYLRWSFTIDFEELYQIEYGSTATSYEPYKTSILSCNEDLELRGIGDVQDTLDLITGEKVERIGEVVLDGSEWWAMSMPTTEYSKPTIRVACNNLIKGGYAPNDKLISDKIPIRTAGSYDYEIFGISALYKESLYIQIPRTMIGLDLEENDATVVSQKFKEWFTTFGTVKVQYPLAKESIKTVDLKVVDQNGSVIPTLKSWNTTTHIYSEIPENSLYPILSHSNPTYPVILKPSTKYSIVANSYSNNHTNSAINFNLGGATASTTVGNRVTTITTPSTLTSEELVMSGRGNKLNNVMVIEGDVVGDEPYFEGICDSKSPILSNVGKNLFNVNQALDVNSWVAYPNKPYCSIAFKVKPKTTYSLSCSKNVNVGNNAHFGIFPRGGYYATEDGGWNTSLQWGQSSGLTKTTFTTLDQEVYYMSLYFDSGFTQDNVTNFFTNRVVDIQIEEAATETAYEPYKSNTTTFDQKDDKTIVLRSLPNGTCDTLNVETGEYVQKIGERNYQDGDTNSNTLVTDCTKTHYKLSSPIITKVDVQGFPHAYKNGYIQLSSGSTEPSLTPTVTYKVPVSRVGQIASNTKSNLRQTIKLDQLEVLVYQSLINTEYENLLVQNSVESATSFTNLSTNDPKDELYYMLKHLIEEDQPVQNMLDKINLFYLYGLLSDEHYFDLLLGGEEDVY